MAAGGTAGTAAGLVGNIRGDNRRLRQAVVVHAVLVRQHVLERPRGLELLDELVDVRRLAADDDQRNLGLAIVDRRPDRREHHVRRQRGLELVEELGPRKRPAIDQGIGLARGCGHDLQLLLVDVLPRLSRLAREIVGRRPVLAHCGGQHGVLPRQPHDLDEVRDRQAEDHQRHEADREVDGALVVERTRRQVGAQHHATRPADTPGRSRSSTPTGAASASSSPGLALMRSRIVAAALTSSSSTRPPTRSSSAPAQALGLVDSRHRRAGEHDAREAAAAEPVLVIHRRLVDEVREVAFPAERAVAEEHEVAAPHDGERRVVVRDVHQQPVPARRAGRGELRVDQAEAGDVDEARVHARRLARALEALDHVPARHRHDELAAAAVDRDPRHPGHLRVLDPEGRGLLDLPVNQLVEVLRLGRHLLESDERDLRGRVRNDQRHAACARGDLLQRGLDRRGERRLIVHVRRVERRRDDARRQRLDGVARDHGLAARLGEREHGDVALRDLERHRRRRTRQPARRRGPCARRTEVSALIRRTSPC